MMQDFRRRFMISLFFTVPIVILSPFLQSVLGYSIVFPGNTFIVFGMAAFLYLYGGKPFLGGMYNELREHTPGMMTLIGLAISVAFFYSSAVALGLSGATFFWELATLIDVMLLGHYIEMKSVLGASRALEEMAKLVPTKAHRITDEGVEDINVSKLAKGDKVLVKPGEKIPSDGTVYEGETSVNEAMLTGESEPVYKKAGDKVIGGALNIEGSLKVKIEKTGEDTYLSQVLDLVRKAQETKSKTQDLANKAAYWLTIISISVGLVTLITWLSLGRSSLFALERMVTVMVITCPHALGLAIPLVVAVSTSLSAKEGILIRNRDSFERVRNIDAVVFDKTGTLTEGKFVVTDILSFNSLEEKEILRHAATLESHSEHPIGQGIVATAQDRGINLYEVEEFESITGKGIKGRIKKNEVMVVSPGFIKEKDLWQESESLNKVLEQGKTVVFVVIDEELVGAIALADKIRKEAKAAVAKLQEMGIHVYMLTGDNKKVAKWVAEELDLAGYYAEILPHEKVAYIQELQEEYKVAMVGDGINDGPALVEADVGIAIGAGTDVAIESADIILVKNDLKDVIAAMRLSKATYQKMLQNLGWATGYNIITIPLAAGILFNYGFLLPPAVGAIVMSVSTVIVAINSRFLKI